MPIPLLARAKFLLNGVAGNNQHDAAIAALANGQVAMAWSSNDTNTADDDARFSFRRANGNVISLAADDEPLAANAAIDEREPDVAALANGRAAYVWAEISASGESDVFAQVRNADGSLFKSRFAITTVANNANSDQLRPSIIGLDGGSFMVTWIDFEPATDRVRIAVADSAGNVSPALTVSLGTVVDHTSGFDKIIRLANGNVVVSWTGGVVSTSDQQKFAIVSAAGALIKSETDVNPEDAVREITGEGSAVALADGNFVEIFRRTDGPSQIQGRLFDEDGNALGARFDISAGIGLNSSAAALRDGRFMVAYDGSGDTIKARVLFADGAPDGAEFVIATIIGSAGQPDLTTLADGRVMVAWDSAENGADEVFAAIYDPREQALDATGTNLNDDWVGTGFADTVDLGLGSDVFQGGAGDDVVTGGDAVDVLQGEGGDDTLIGGLGGDTLSGGADNDTLEGGEGTDFLVGSLGTDTAVYSNATVRVKAALDASFAGESEAAGDIFSGVERLTGSAFGDVLRGDANSNRLLGANGADTLQGRDGNDSFLGGNGADAVTGGLGNDFFDFTALSHAGDIIKDFNNVAGDNDSLRFTGSVFGGLAAGSLDPSRFAAAAAGTATTAAHRFIYETDTGILRFDSNGTGAGGVTLIATFTGAPSVTAADIVIL